MYLYLFYAYFNRIPETGEFIRERGISEYIAICFLFAIKNYLRLVNLREQGGRKRYSKSLADWEG